MPPVDTQLGLGSLGSGVVPADPTRPRFGAADHDNRFGLRRPFASLAIGSHVHDDVKPA